MFSPVSTPRNVPDPEAFQVMLEKNARPATLLVVREFVVSSGQFQGLS